MKKLTIEMLTNVYKNPRLVHEFKGNTYVQIDDAYVDDINRDLDEWGCKACAVRVGDEMDEYGYVPAYTLCWISKYAAEETMDMDMDEFVDFDEVDDVWENGEIDLSVHFK